jgi:hypothetical protein
MSLPLSVCKWLRLPSQIALLLGMGALSAAGPKAAVAEAHLGNGLMRVPQQSAKSFDEVRIWSDAGRIYVSEAGRDPQELPLGDTPEARHLRQLLERDGAIVNSPRALQHRMILVGGGGEAIHWGSAKPSRGRDRAGNAATARDSNAIAKPRTKPSGQAGSTDNPNIAGADRQR